MKNCAMSLAALIAASAFADPNTMPLEEVASRIPHETSEETAARLSWWTEARFGMFIHFGLYAMPARHEWIRNYEEISNEDYEKYFERFDPDLFDASAWAKAAKEAGMKYVVLTTKHHEGFCMFDSKATDYKITNTPFGRDLVAEFVEAVRAEGLKVGFYYSLLDWHHPDFTVDGLHPLRNGDVDKLNEGRDMARYRQYMKDQVTELLTNYGKIDIMWFDFSYPRNDKWGKGRDDWDSPGLLTLARTLQPGIIVDNRMDLNDVENGFDFMTPEQFKVTEWPTHNGRRHPWETCQTFSGSWGYFRDETSWKSDAQCLDLLISTVAHGGNLIMNVGPTARGEFDGRARERLDGYGRWMHANSRSIYGCTEAPEGFEAPEHSVLTYNPKANRLYIHLFHYPAGQLGVKFGSKIAYAQFLHDGSEIQVKPMPDWQAKASDSTGYDSYLNFPVLKPAVEIPVIECYLK